MTKLAALAVALLVASTSARADETAIKSVFDDFQTRWNTPGMPGFEKLFATDADFVVITGQWLRGREEIVSYHRDLLQSLYAGSRQFVDSVTVRFIDKHNAVAHVAWGADFTKDGNRIRRTALGTVTLRKQDRRWLIQTVHNTLTGGPGTLSGGAQRTRRWRALDRTSRLRPTPY